MFSFVVLFFAKKSHPGASGSAHLLNAAVVVVIIICSSVYLCNLASESLPVAVAVAVVTWFSQVSRRHELNSLIMMTRDICSVESSCLTPVILRQDNITGSSEITCCCFFYFFCGRRPAEAAQNCPYLHTYA